MLRGWPLAVTRKVNEGDVPGGTVAIGSIVTTSDCEVSNVGSRWLASTGDTPVVAPWQTLHGALAGTP
jgi:hypothetical protein